WMGGEESAAEGERARLKVLAGRFSREDLLRAFDVLTRAETDIRSAAVPRHHLEMALLRWIYLRKLTPLEDLITGAGNVAASGPRSVPAPRPSSPPAPPPKAPAPSGPLTAAVNAASRAVTAAAPPAAPASHSEARVPAPRAVPLESAPGATIAGASPSAG